jgi:hypothetical protein
MADGSFEPRKRPASPAPGPNASREEREKWSEDFISWFIEITGGEVGDMEPAGHRWRTEFFSCVDDPAAYEHLVAVEIDTATRNQP